MSRSRRKPYIKDSTNCNKFWKRQATRALRRAKEAISGMFYKNYSVVGLGVTIVGMILIIRKLIGNSLTLIDKNVTMLI